MASKRKQAAAKIIIIVAGGTVIEVRSDRSDFDIEIIDMDEAAVADAQRRQEIRDRALGAMTEYPYLLY